MNDPLLLAELRKQRAEIDHLKADNNHLKAMLSISAGEIVQLNAAFKALAEQHTQSLNTATTLCESMHAWALKIGARIEAVENSRRWADSFMGN